MSRFSYNVSLKNVVLWFFFFHLQGLHTATMLFLLSISSIALLQRCGGAYRYVDCCASYKMPAKCMLDRERIAISDGLVRMGF